MQELLGKTKETIGIMFDRINTILNNKGIPQDSFMMKVAFYRNYNAYYDSDSDYCDIYGQS